LREIGERFNTSRETVRQIQAKISKNLAKNLRSSENPAVHVKGAVWVIKRAMSARSQAS